MKLNQSSVEDTLLGNLSRNAGVNVVVICNVVQIPVEVETPDHHYYHLAFFTTKKMEAFEELTWVVSAVPQARKASLA
ncbi:hypothetical protein GUJ93_ZPchr0009g2266 [Zizania palustris]|uniref:Uncharacterized protein n=1 Tax=Zizania palustris TaxID=103762 RepID=A0A8J5RSQ2_ZIZPA|nr:hypothetical protein GUJ93_ZPchr0009g2266 [Zizania palustris]